MWLVEASELLVVASNFVGEGVDGGVESGDLVGESGDASAVGGAVAVLFDDGADGGVAVEAAAAEAGQVGDGGEGDGVSVVVELGAGSFDLFEGVGVGHPVASLIKMSSRAMSRWWRSASSIQPRSAASRARASASTRWAARMGSELGSAR